MRRATISARDGSPRRAGSVEDISTPIIVPCIASASLIRAFGSAALRIACQEKARITIAEHIAARPSSTYDGSELISVVPMFEIPIFCSAM